MLELMGKGYVIEHCICEHNKRMKERDYQIYMTDLLKGLAEFVGLQVNVRYADLFKVQTEQEEKTGDEGALEVIKNIGLKTRHDSL